MKRLTIFILLFLSIKTGFAQVGVGVRVYNYRPTGEFGFVMKPTYTAEIMFIDEFRKKKRTRFNFSATYLHMKPRMAEFPRSS